jgi:hypothetical protein
LPEQPDKSVAGSNQKIFFIFSPLSNALMSKASYAGWN